MIEEHHFGAPEDGLAIPERAALRRDGSAVHAEPKAIGASRRFCGAVIQVPDLDTPRIVPVDSLPVDRIFPVARLRQRRAGFIANLSPAIFAVTDAVPPQTAPAIVGEALGVAALDDLGQ